MADRAQIFGLLGDFGDGRFNGTMQNVVGRPCCHGKEIWPRRGDLSPTGLSLLLLSQIHSLMDISESSYSFYIGLFSLSYFRVKLCVRGCGKTCIT